MIDATARFDWDDGNREKCRKHGIALAEIEELFRGTPRIAPTRKHASAEERFVAVGRNSRGRAMFVVFSLRQRDGDLLIRPLSARYMHREEIEKYEKKSPDVQDR